MPLGAVPLLVVLNPGQRFNIMGARSSSDILAQSTLIDGDGTDASR